MVAGLIQFLTGAQARWRGIDPLRADGSVPQRVYFANHASNLDAPVIWASLPKPLRRATRPVAARDYWAATPIRRHLANNVFHCVLIERQKVSARNNPLAAMEEALAGGSSLILFPEGTRTTDDEGEMATFKPGLWHLAKKNPQVELVPVYLENLNRILPKGEFILIPLLAAVTFGAAMRIEEGEEKMDFLKRAKSAVEQLSEGVGG
jgi:1-acyl-sn-glycerol-3-phosphate acyltransferase